MRTLETQNSLFESILHHIIDFFREFTEEALGGKQNPELNVLWRRGVELYRGYVDDPRNTDNAWVETVVVNFHDSEGVLNNVTLTVTDSP